MGRSVPLSIGTKLPDSDKNEVSGNIFGRFAS